MRGEIEAEGHARAAGGARSDLVAAGGWALVALVASASVAGFEPSLLEEGLQLHTAERLAAGDHMFRDIASFTGPLPFELLGWLFRLLGSEVWVARAAVAVLHAVSCAATFAFVRAVCPPVAHAAAAVVASEPVLLFPLVSWYWYTTVCLHLCAPTGWLALRALRSPRAAFAAGLAVSAIALCKQTVGAVAALLLLACIARFASDRSRGVGAYLAGGIAATALVMSFYGLRGDAWLMFEQMVVWPLGFEQSFAVPFPNFWPPGVVDESLANPAYYLPSLYSVKHGGFVAPGLLLWGFTQFLFLSPFLALGVAFASAGLRGGAHPAVWIQASLLAAFTTHMWPRSDWGHICYVVPLAAVQLLISLPRTQAEGRSAGPSWLPGLGAALAVGLMLATGGAAQYLHGLAGDVDYGPRLPLRGVSQASNQVLIPKTIAYLRERVEPGEPIFVTRSEPLLYFATGTTNPTPYVGVYPGFKDEQQRVILEGLERVRFVAMSDIDQPLYLYYRDELPRVQRYLERHFRVVRRIPPGYMTLLERGQDLGATHDDLFDRASEARYWVRDRDGQRVVSNPELPTLGTVQNHRPLAFPLAERGGGVDFRVDLPPGPSTFRSGVGLRHIFGLKALHQHPDAATLSVSIRREDGDQMTPLASRSIEITERRGWRWLPLEAELDAFAGQRVWIRLELRSPRAIEAARRVAWFGSPRVVVGDERIEATSTAGNSE